MIKTFIHRYLFLGISSITLMFSMSLSYPNPTHTVVLHVTNIKKIEGTMEIGIFQDSKNFPHEGAQMYKVRIPIKSASLIHEFEDLSEGEYAFAIYQDINNDSICNTNFFGYPKEPFAFSNNVRPFLKAPSFKKAKFKVPEKKHVFVALDL